MISAPNEPSRRILVIDDNPSIHEDFRKILAENSVELQAFTGTKALLFDEAPASTALPIFDISSALQGAEGLEMVDAAHAAGQPFALAFVDVRMPPGWDGIETVMRIWQRHPELQVVICTAYSDYSWGDMIRRLGPSSNMVVLKKPFDNIEVLQLAHALTTKWILNQQVQEQIRELDARVAQRTAQLNASHQRLEQEVAERRQIAQALALSEERFVKAFNANPVPLAIQALTTGTFSNANPSFEQLSGYRRDELLGHQAEQLRLWPGDAQHEKLRHSLADGATLRHAAAQLAARDGTLHDVLLSTERIELADGPHLLIAFQDITEQLLLEEQLRQAQKMEAVGQLAAGIAHDFNNMLTVIQGNASMLHSDCAVHSPDLPLLDGILAAAARSAKLVRQLLTFSQKQTLEIRPVRPIDIVGPLATMLPPMIGEQIHLITTVAPGLPRVPVDLGMMEQMLVNFAVNARDAMPHGGSFTIAASACCLNEDDCRNNPLTRPGHYLKFSVSDTGTGIPAEVLPRIFEPFFTTKPVGEGTGLGLATVYAIVRQHQGWLDVASELGCGTTFHVYLPLCCPAETAKFDETQSAETQHPRGSAHIFLVEDEEIVRLCVAHVLESHGYTVTTATDGHDALRIWERDKDKFQLLLTDIVMPEGMNGLELGRQLQRDRPALKIIYSSGYSPDLVAQRSPQLDAHNFLPKPYQAGTLLRVVSQALA